MEKQSKYDFQHEYRHGVGLILQDIKEKNKKRT